MTNPLGFDAPDSIANLAKVFDGPLSAKEIQRALVNAITAELRAAQRLHRQKATETHSFTKKQTATGIRISRPNANTGNLSGRLYASSRPVSLMEFYKGRGPVSVHVKSPKTLPGAFVAVKAGKRSSSDADAMGLFEREEKDFPTKGRWAGYVVKRGKNKGKHILRARLRKLHTASVGPVFFASSEAVLAAVELPKKFEDYLQKAIAKKAGT